MESLAIVGTGLMGGSFGLSALALGLVEEVAGYDLRPENAERALERGAVTRVAADPLDAVARATMVVVATPVGAVLEVIRAVAPALRAGAIVTDVGSTKGGIVAEAARILPPAAHFIGGHPLSGSEREGIEAADPGLYRGCVWILTPSEEIDAAAYGRLVRFLGALGARVLSLDPARHDELVALTSHLPQLLASTLMGFAADAAASEEAIPMAYSGGFRDMTRIAASPPELWVDILRQNRDALLEVLGRFESALSHTGELLRSGEWEQLRDAFAAAGNARRGMPAKPGLAPAAIVELAIPVPDRPGVLAEVTTLVGEAGVNIEDIDIVHAPEGGRGTIHLAVEGEAAARRAREKIEERGFTVELRRR